MVGRVVAGFVLVAIGTVFLLGETDVIDRPGRVIGSWWPVVLVVIGLSIAVEQRRFGAGPLIFLVTGVALLAATSDVVALDVRVVWPAILILIGLWVLLRPRWRGATSMVDSRIAVTAIFEDRKVRASAITFEQASLTTIFGDLDLDLRDALPGEDMTVDITVVFGDLDVMVPADWRVAMAASSVFAEVEHDTPREAPGPDAPVLRVRGFSVFGDVKVRQ